MSIEAGALVFTFSGAVGEVGTEEMFSNRRGVTRLDGAQGKKKV